jgi:hypothetical protein
MSDKKNSRKRKRLPRDMKTPGRKNKRGRPSKKIDYLTNLPENILLRILSNVSMSSFLDLCQTHSHLRWFIHNYAATICNHAILAHFYSETVIMEVKEIDGWLTPTNWLFHIKPRKGARWVVPGLQLQLHSPGPQFLYFLEKMVLKFSNNDALLVEWKVMQRFLDGLNEESPVVYGGQNYPCWVWLREMVWYHGVPS